MKIDLKYCVVKFKDNGSNNVTIKVGEGTLTWSEKKNIEYVLDRGLLDGTREGDQVPVDIKIDMLWESLRGAGSVATPYDALTHTGGAAAWVSTGNLCEPYAIDVEVVYTYPCGTGRLETYLFPDFRPESIDGDFKAGTLTASGKANVIRPTITATAGT